MARNSIKEFDFPLAPIDVNDVFFTPFIMKWGFVERAHREFRKHPNAKNRARVVELAREYEYLAGPKDAAEVWMRFLKSQDRF